MGIRKGLAVVISAVLLMAFIPSLAYADSTGWQGNYTDGWRYYISDKDYVKSSWKLIDNYWYYFDGDGIALTDRWEVIKGKLYHFSKGGAMDANKWVSCGDFQMSDLEKMFSEENSDYAQAMSEYTDKKVWRYVGADGDAYTGWRKVGGKWYHFNDEDISLIDTEENHQNAYAAMTYGFYYDLEEEAWFNFDGEGLYRKDCWYEGPGEYGMLYWYYFGKDGHAYSDWVKMNDKWYYFATDSYDFEKDLRGPGTMTTGWRDFYETYDDDGYSVDYDIYLFDEDGVMLKGWTKYNGCWYYSDPDGSVYKNRWFKYNGKWYFFDRLGVMVENAEKYEIDGIGYNFDANGACTNPYDGIKISGWYERIYDSDLYFCYEDGNAWSYVDKNGKKICSVEGYMIGGKAYDFDSLGICKNPYSGRVAEEA